MEGSSSTRQRQYSVVSLPLDMTLSLPLLLLILHLNSLILNNLWRVSNLADGLTVNKLTI